MQQQTWGHVYYSKDALVNGLIGTTAPVKKHIKRNVNFFELGFDADWEFDLFGMTAHEIAALKAHEEAVQESLCAVWITLSAEIAKKLH
jgi:outer membrane protein TolC